MHGHGRIDAGSLSLEAVPERSRGNVFREIDIFSV
jgi:hypothetical protein